MITQILSRDIAFIDRAMWMATHSYCKKQHGALVTKGSRIMASGWNIPKTHPANPTQRSVHAEASAIISMKNSPKGCTLFSFRSKAWRRSKPCPDCMNLIKAVGIKYIVYSTETEIIKERL